MPAIRSGYSCPTCKRLTGDTNEVLADGGRLRCSKVEAHLWPDIQDFMDLNPRLDFKQEQPKFQNQTGHVDLTVKVPLRVKNAVSSRFAEKADATVAGLLSMMAEGECMVIGETDLQRISSVLPERPKSGSHLFGMITALIYARDEAKQVADAAAKELKAYEGMAGTRVMVDLGDQYGNATQRAQAENLPTKVFVERVMRTGFENNWF